MIATLLAAFSPPAAAQALAPMEGRLVAFGRVGLVRLTVTNPYEAAHAFTLDAFDEDWRRLPDVAVPAVPLGGGGEARIAVPVPMPEPGERTVRLCVTSGPMTGRGISMRGQVCGKYVVTRPS